MVFPSNVCTKNLIISWSLPWIEGGCEREAGSSTASFKVAEAPEVEAADLGRLFWKEGTTKKKKKRSCEEEEEEEEEAEERGTRALEGKRTPSKRGKGKLLLISLVYFLVLFNYTFSIWKVIC
ncbi:hypothetical protein TIFTF001_052811 [Ficus carica]|uniref:Uncharacterized protein n=1 Tax=Ficus carica TaxID=3494 RepID=A0AA88EFL7_FICCA|nr:hypothetical protein TIFTF001_052811 [Ficus carica]